MFGEMSHGCWGLVPGEQGFAVDPDGDGLANGIEAWVRHSSRGFQRGNRKSSDKRPGQYDWSHHESAATVGEAVERFFLRAGVTRN